MDITESLKKLGLSLPEASTPGGAYESVNVRGNIVYVAIQFPILNGDYLYQGRLGEEISTEAGFKATQLCALNVITQINKRIGFDKLAGLNHFDLYFVASDGWDEAPEMANAASELFVALLGDKGKHSRAIFGVEKLPRKFCVGLTSSFTLS